MVLAGVLDIDASRKAARFVRFCDCFNIPIVTFVDVPGFLPGTAQEYGGLIKHGAKLLFAYAEATVSEGHASSPARPMAAPMTSWRRSICAATSTTPGPTAQIAVMGAKGAVEIIFRSDIGDPEKIAAAHQGIRGPLPVTLRRRRARLYRRGDHAARDAPANCAARWRMLRDKKLENPWKKHDNIPL